MLLQRKWHILKLSPGAITLAAWVFLMLVVARLSSDPAKAFERQTARLRFSPLFAGIAQLVPTDEARIKKAHWRLLLVFLLIAGDLIFYYLSGAYISGTKIQGGHLTSILNRPTSG